MNFADAYRETMDIETDDEQKITITRMDLLTAVTACAATMMDEMTETDPDMNLPSLAVSIGSIHIAGMAWDMLVEEGR